MILDSILGTKALKKQRNLAMDFADEYYGGQARAMSESKNLAKQQAIEGVSDTTTDTLRQSALSNIFGGQQNFGSNAGTAIAQNAVRSESGQKAVVGLESQIAGMEEEAMAKGREQYSGITAEQSRLFAVRDAAKKQVGMQYEAERDARRQDLFATGVGLATTFLPGSGIGKQLKKVMGDGVGALGAFFTGKLGAAIEGVEQYIPEGVNNMLDSEVFKNQQTFMSGVNDIRDAQEGFMTNRDRNINPFASEAMGTPVSFGETTDPSLAFIPEPPSVEELEKQRQTIIDTRGIQLPSVNEIMERIKREEEKPLFTGRTNTSARKNGGASGTW